MMKFIATTTINEPTEALIKYSQMPDWTLVVAGDKKTPEAMYRDINCVYLTPEMQETMHKELSDTIGWFSVQRRNFAILYAYQQGADLIAVVDDDNIPLENWGKNLYVGKEVTAIEYITQKEVVDPLFVTEHSYLWHRGYPIDWVHSRSAAVIGQNTFIPMVQANLWEGNPDIDAIARHVFNPTQIKFTHSTAVPFTSKKFMPFNSQNTILHRDIIKDYFLAPGIGRMDDIWASYYVQALGHRVIFGEATVFQKRNEHNIMKDMQLEYLGYEQTSNLVCDLVKQPQNIFNYLPPQAAKAFKIWQDIFR